MDKTSNIDRSHKALLQEQFLAERDEQARHLKGDHNVLCGDFREIGQQVADNSVALIVTDPPYGKEYLDLYVALGEFAARVLEPGGLCLAYSGSLYLPDKLAALGQSLEYYWTFAVAYPDRKANNARRMGNSVRKPRIYQSWKPIVGFVKPPLNCWWHFFGDVLPGNRQKAEHVWQQNVEEARYLIEHLAPPNGTVIDPMCGSGTSLVAAAQLGRPYVGIELNKATAARARARLAEEARPLAGN
jgi:site-specific DNA-methyltransferase (adenine-specific)